MGGSRREWPFGRKEAGLNLFCVASLAKDIPSFSILALIFFDFCFRSLQWVVRSIVSAVEKEGVWVSPFFDAPMLINKIKSVVGDNVGGVKWFSFVISGNFPRLAVEPKGVVAREEVGCSGKVAPVAVETKVRGLFRKMPFSDHHRMVFGGFEDLSDTCTA